MKRFGPILVFVALLFLVGSWVVYSYLAPGKNDFLKSGPISLAPSPTPSTPTGATNSALNRLTTVSKNALSALLKQEEKPTSVAYKVESFAQDLKVPWSMVFTSGNRVLVTERPGRVRVIENGQLFPTPIKTFSVSNQSEEGLMGMVLDPDYEQNKYLYICLAYGTKAPIYDKVVRLTDKGSELADEKTIIDKIPAAEYHAGCRLRFGPDKKLYVSTGDARQKSLPQDLNSLGGKILRLNGDGTIPEGNPFGNSPVYSYGHRNPQGFDWHPLTGMMVETEHGPSGNDGPGGGDEVNIIKPGQNYGWPIVSHSNSKEGMISPLLEWTPAIAPASGMFYSGSVFPQFANNFFFGMLRGEGITRIVFDTSNPEVVSSYEKLPGVEVGRVRDLVQGPDGFIYFTTSNQDSRGTARAGDDHIYRLVPAQ